MNSITSLIWDLTFSQSQTYKLLLSSINSLLYWPRHTAVIDKGNRICFLWTMVYSIQKIQKRVAAFGLRIQPELCEEWSPGDGDESQHHREVQNRGGAPNASMVWETFSSLFLLLPPVFDLNQSYIPCQKGVNPLPQINSNHMECYQKAIFRLAACLPVTKHPSHHLSGFSVGLTASWLMSLDVKGDRQRFSCFWKPFYRKITSTDLRTYISYGESPTCRGGICLATMKTTW